MEYFYSAATMGFHGEGYWWHKLVGGFPKLQFVAKTITYEPRRGKPWNFCDIPFTKSMWNKIGLHNDGFYEWCRKYKELPEEVKEKLIPSIYGTTYELEKMIDYMYKLGFSPPLVELNLSCPNVTNHENKKIPDSPFALSVKLAFNSDPYKYFIINEKIKRVTLNSVPANIATNFMKTGGISGKRAKPYNWHFINKYLEDLKKHKINIAGCSITCLDDVYRLEEMGVTEIALGSILFTDPLFVKKLLKEKENEN